MEVNLSKTLKNETERIKEILINKEAMNEEYNKTRQEVLKKAPEDIELFDLPYLRVSDAIYPKLPFRYRREVKLRDKLDFIFEQMTEIYPLLKDKSINEINLNQEGDVWILKVGEGKFKTNITISPDRAMTMLFLIADFKNLHFDEKSNPIMSTKLPTGERITCAIGEPVNFCPTFSIRKPPSRIFPLEEYVESNKMTTSQYEALLNEIKNGSNILIIGGVGTGKTTLGNACLNAYKGTSRRVIIIEDVPELICDCEDKVFFTTSEEASVGYDRLLKTAMRYNGDIVVLGEILDGIAASILLTLWNSGSKGGLTTIHANDGNGGLSLIHI